MMSEGDVNVKDIVPAMVHAALPYPARRAGTVCRRNWSQLHWRCSSFATNLKLYCFSEPTRERGRHDVVIRLRGHKSILQLVSAVSWTIEDDINVKDIVMSEDDVNVKDIVMSEDDLGVTHVDGLSKKDLERVRSLALIDLTALFDMHGIAYVRRKAKGRGRGSKFTSFFFSLLLLLLLLF